MNTRHTTTIASIAGGVVLGALMTVGLMALGLTALADGDPTTDTVPRVLPYQGTLEQNGQPIHAVGDNALAMRFSLYDGLEGEEAVYIQDLSVEVFAGRFTANIGPEGTNALGDTTSIIEVIQAADDLHLGMTLLGDVDDPEDDIALSNRQRIHASPYSMWTTSATSLDVATDLEVGGMVTTSGLQTGTLDIQGADLRLGTNDGSPVGANPNQRALAHAPGDVLNVNADGDFEGGTQITGDAHVTGNLLLDGALSGRIVGGAVVACTSNSASNLRCSPWGAADCGGGGCARFRCNRGNLRVISGAYECYSDGWGRACQTMLCIE